jgi:hypothetical protein
VATVGGVLAFLLPSVLDLLAGVIVGVVLVFVVVGVTRVVKGKRQPAAGPDARAVDRA